MSFMSLRGYCFLFFFFKQKTAYEMRISDWSSDVCSSDLDETFLRQVIGILVIGCHVIHRGVNTLLVPLNEKIECGVISTLRLPDKRPIIDRGNLFRSEEHTSELQSLMRISYAVFCLTKKIKAI